MISTLDNMLDLSSVITEIMNEDFFVSVERGDR